MDDALFVGGGYQTLQVEWTVCAVGEVPREIAAW